MQSNLKRKNFIEQVKAPIFLYAVLAIEIYNVRARIQFRRESQPQNISVASRPQNDSSQLLWALGHPKKCPQKLSREEFIYIYIYISKLSNEPSYVQLKE